MVVSINHILMESLCFTLKYIYLQCDIYLESFLMNNGKLKHRKELRLKEIDINFNFIHLCTEKQLLDTIRIHQNIEEIVILRLSSRGLEPNLKWEMSRNNDLFHY